MSGKPVDPRPQRGSVAVIVALSIAVLIGMIGLAIDLGRMFVIKTELQNAADACALAAARELDGIGGAKLRADAAGILVGTRNEINFQKEDAPITTASLSYSDTLSPNSAYNRIISDTDAKFAMCTVSRPNIGMLFMGVLGFGSQTVNAYAVATLGQGQTTCAIPLGLCQQTSGSDPYAGLDVGQWYGGKFDNNGGSGGGGGGGTPICFSPGSTTGTSGNFNWIDFSPPAGGSTELKALLEGVGKCELPPIDTPVGQTGTPSNLDQAWNTRFGIYETSYNFTDVDTSPPDFTGIAYTNSNFPVGQTENTWPTALPTTPPNVYNGAPATGSTPNYVTASAARNRYQVASDPLKIGNGASGINALPQNGTPSHTTNGQSRRLTIAPIINCQSLCTLGTTTTPILGYACVLMLSPVPNNPGNIYLEYRGRADDPASGCGSFGLPGGNGPLIPVLVQ